jgi:nucleoside-diphosphate-sugar epimerase
MSVVVTGCAGFIGSRVSHVLLDQGESIIGIDNLNDAYDVRLKNWRLGKLESHSRFRFHPLDIGDYQALKPLFRSETERDSGPISCVLNLGARAGVRASVEDPWVYYHSNTLGTLNLLELCKEHGIQKFVLSSTSSAYGENTPRPFVETADTSRPLSPYAASKMAAETLVYSYHHLHGLDATVLRYFTVYGPAGRPDMAIFRFIRAIAEGEPITVFGDGTQERDFSYIDDIARGTVAAQKNLGYEIINLGSDRPVVLTEIIGMIERELKQEARIDYAPRHCADVLATWANVNKARDLLGWEPRVPIEEGIKLSVDWYRENQDWAKSIH